MKFVYCRNSTSYDNFKLKLCMCAQSYAFGTRTNFQLEILNIHVISGIVYFREIILETSRNVCETILCDDSVHVPSQWETMWNCCYFVSHRLVAYTKWSLWDTHLGVLGIAGLLDLVGPLLGEANAEQSQEEAISRLHVYVGLDQRLQEFMCKWEIKFVSSANMAANHVTGILNA